MNNYKSFIKMLSVKAEFCPLDCIQAVQQQLFHTTKCICAKCF